MTVLSALILVLSQCREADDAVAYTMLSRRCHFCLKYENVAYEELIRVDHGSRADTILHSLRCLELMSVGPLISHPPLGIPVLPSIQPFRPKFLVATTHHIHVWKVRVWGEGVHREATLSAR